MNIDLSSKNHLTKFSNSYHPIYIQIVINIFSKWKRYLRRIAVLTAQVHRQSQVKIFIPGVKEFQDGKDLRFSTPKISTNLLLGEEIRTTDEFPFLEEFHNNDSKILSLLNQQTGSYYSFKGLMRKLNLHQQSLTRALGRLEHLGLIRRSEHGYKLTIANRRAHKACPLLKIEGQASINSYCKHIFHQV